MLDPFQDMSLAIVPLNGLDRGPHVLPKPIDIGPILEPEGCIRVPEAVDGPLSALAIKLKAGLR